MNKLPLLVHFVFYPDSNSARELATGLHRSLNHDASVPGLDIPTTFCNYSDQSPPANQGLDRAERSFVVVLADEYLVAGVNAGAWQGFIADIWRDHHSATRTRNNWFGQLRQDIAVPRSATRIQGNQDAFEFERPINDAFRTDGQTSLFGWKTSRDFDVRKFRHRTLRFLRQSS